MLIGAAGAGVLSNLASALRSNTQPASFQPDSDDARTSTSAQSATTSPGTATPASAGIDTAASKLITDLKSLLLSVQSAADPSGTNPSGAASQAQPATPPAGHHHHHHAAADANAAGATPSDPLSRIFQALKAYGANNATTAAPTPTTVSA